MNESNQLDGTPIPLFAIRMSDVVLFAGMAAELIDKHPETAIEFFTEALGSPPPAGFLEAFQADAIALIKQIGLANQQLQTAVAQQEASQIPKEKLN